MIPAFLENPALLRLGWALLHSLWQATLIALALKGALMLVEKQASRLRYGLALACLFLMAASPVFLLCKPQREHPSLSSGHSVAQIETAPADAGTAITTAAAVSAREKADLTTRILNSAAPLVPVAAAVWILIALLLVLKTAGSVVQVLLFKWKEAAHCETKATPAFQELAERSKIGEVPVLESSLVFVPTVAGWFRPLVLLPKGSLEKFNRPALDALVAHEFAHIRRGDCIVNLLQTFVENLLFFHPSMWWVTRNVRAEREACCDDEAVALCGDTRTYVRALSQAEQFRSSMPVIALSSSPLLDRIRRLTEMRISTNNRLTSFCISCAAVLFIIAAAIGSVSLSAIPAQHMIAGASSNIAATNSRQQMKTGQENPQYSLLCGIVAGSADALRKAVPLPPPPPPPPNDDKQRVGGCILLDVSTPGAHTRVQGELKPAELLHKVDPVYPESAIRYHVGVRVMVKVDLNEEGLVTDANVTASQTVPPDRDSEGRWLGGVPAGVVRDINLATVTAVKQWKYSPTLLEGKAIPVRASISITYTFDKDGSPKIVSFIG